MVAQPPGVANHPAWVIGHLTHTCELLGAVIGVAPWLPGHWTARFGTGSVPVADASAYDAKDDLLAALRDAQARIASAVSSLNDEQLGQAFPDASYRDVFPTIRHALTQVMVGHTAMHVGQLIVWRRAMGLPRLSRGFE